jgi:FkbM family methyltransferase
MGMVARKLMSLARRFGVEIAPAWLVPSLPLCEHLRLLFRVYGIDCVLDVGANTGQFRDLLRHRIGFRGPILSFEPDPACMRVLRSRGRHDRSWHLYPLALGSRDETATLNLCRESGMNSLHAPLPDTAAPLASAIVGHETVQVRRLDSLRSELRPMEACRNVYLKLDVQGHEIDALHGATETLAVVPAIQCELNVMPLYEGVPDYRTALPSIEALGYVPAGFYPVTLDRRARMVDFDCVFVREDA